MDESQDILDGFNAGYIIQQQRPELFEQLQDAIKEVDLPFFDSMAQGGKEYSEERFKSLLVGKEHNSTTPSEETLSKDEPDIDMED